MTDNWLEKAIAEAQERGAFDNIAGAGEPIKSLGGTYDPAWWAKGFVARENAREAGIELMAEIDRQLPAMLARSDLDDVKEQVGSWNEAIALVNRSLDLPDRLTPLDTDEIARRWSNLRT